MHTLFLRTLFRLFCFSAILLSACAKPLPADKLNYAGTWQNDDSSIQLVISKLGQMQYREYRDANNYTVLSGPIRSFNRQKILFGFGPFSKEFMISQAPHLNSNGIWSMTINGEYLNRVH